MLPEVERSLEDAIGLTESLGLRVLLVGAWARDLCLPLEARGRPRKTNDADLAILVDDWDVIDTLFDGALARFDVNRPELFLRHREQGVKVDIVPCGRIEEPAGQLRLRKLHPRLQHRGTRSQLRHCEPPCRRSTNRAHPRPSAYVLLKLLSYMDRKAPRDLRDLGYVATRYTFDPNTVWDDETTRNAMADQTLFFEDLPAWCLGLDLKKTFGVDVVQVFRGALGELAGMAPWHRGRLAHQIPDPEKRLREADRLITVLLASAQ